jgi:hypothetical protein
MLRFVERAHRLGSPKGWLAILAWSLAPDVVIATAPVTSRVAFAYTCPDARGPGAIASSRRILHRSRAPP